MRPSLLNSLIFAAALAAVSHAEPATGPAAGLDYDAVVTDIFWRELYPAGGWTLLCGEHFGADRRLADGRSVSIDHAYPVAAMVRALKCVDRARCRARPGGKFARMESDLHNLYPEPQELITYRINRVYGIVPGEEWRYETCDVEWRNGVFEPRALARGNIARAVLYMRATYQLPVSDADLEMYKQWNREDPPSKQEQERNATIERVQGQRNTFINRPELVENLRNLKK
jgi:deoxyribonuclease-1